MTTRETALAFADFRLDPGNVALWRGTQALKLKPKAFAVLQYLVAHAGQLVSKDDLWRAVWPDVAVTDGVLAVCLTEIRQALGDDPKAPRFIETVHRRGYRFIAPLTPASPVTSARWQVPRLDAQDSALNAQPSVLVGREPELSQLHRWLETALHGQRQLVFVTGEPGIGKTAIVETFLRHLDTADTLRLGRGQCIEHYGAGEPYLPVLQALGDLGRGADRDYFLTVLRHYAPSWLVQLPALLEPAERESLQRQTAGVTRGRMLREVVDALEAFTTEQGVVLVLEDLHWSDPSTVELLALLARRPAPARLLVVGTYRPVEVIVGDHPLKAAKQELQLHAQCQELPLPLLSEPAVAEYLAAKASGAGHAPTPLPALAHLIHQRTDGNPLFMVTVVEQVLAQRATDAACLETGQLSIPETLRQLIEQQVGRLDLQDQRLLDAASVVGTEFSAAAVAAAIAEDILTVEGRCERLARRGTVLQVRGTAEWPDGTVAGRYGFLHALYQDVLYSRLPAAQRVRLHHQVGEREEQAYGERAREIASELAVHFEQGRDYGKAVQYLQQAGENALRRSAYPEAITHLSKGLEVLKLLPATPERAQHELQILMRLGAPLSATTGYTTLEVERVHTRALDLCRQIGEPPQLFSALLGLCGFYLERAELQKARELAEQGLSLAQNVHDPIFLVWAHRALGDVLYRLGEFALAREHLEEGIALYDSQQQRSSGALDDPKVYCLSFAAMTWWYLGYPDQALQRSHEALTLAQELARPLSVAFALNVDAWLHRFRREVQASQERSEAAIALSTAQEFPFFLALGIIGRGWALAEQGQLEEGITQIRQGLAAWQAMRTELTRPHFLVLLAGVYGKAGQGAEGLTLLAEALALIDKTGERYFAAELHRLKGELTLQQSRHVKAGQNKSRHVRGPKSGVTNPQAEAEAEACFLQAIEIARNQQAKSLELQAATSLSRLWQQQGKKAEAHRKLAELYGWFTEGFDTADLQEAKALLEELA